MLFAGGNIPGPSAYPLATALTRRVPCPPSRQSRIRLPSGSSPSGGCKSKRCQARANSRWRSLGPGRPAMAPGLAQQVEYGEVRSQFGSVFQLILATPLLTVRHICIHSTIVDATFKSNRFIYTHEEACLIFVVLYMCCYVKYVETILRLPRCFIQCDIGIKMIC